MKSTVSFLLRLSLGLLLLAGLSLALGVQVRSAHAATKTTITTCDEATLRTAINNANSGDTIAFGCNGDILLTSPLSINTNLTIDGSGQSVTLDGQQQHTIMVVAFQATLTLNAITFANGNGNSIGASGGLWIDGSANITNSTFTGNSWTSTGSPDGGAIGNEGGGTLTISNSTFSGNSAGLAGGASRTFSGVR